MSKDISNVVSALSPSEARTRITTSRHPVIKGRSRVAESEFPTLPPIKKASDLIGEHLCPPPELVKGLLHIGSTMIYGAPPKSNKTFAMLDLGISVASGTPWWGLDTTKGKVLYLDFELEQWAISERLDRISNAKGLNMEVLENIDVWPLRGQAADLSELGERIGERVKAGGYKLIVLDPLYKVLGNRDENSAGDINSLMNELDRIAVSSGAAIAISHHFSKGNQAGKESIDRVSGSGVFARSPDSIVILTKHEKEDVYTVETTLRNHKRMDPFCVEWSYPLMVRNEAEDPQKLKRAGAAAAKYTPEQLLKILGNRELSSAEWMENTMKEFNMSSRTFASKKAMLGAHNLIEHAGNGKWRAKKTLESAMREPNEETQLQHANAAIAPFATTSSAVCATAMQQLPLTAAAVHAPVCIPF